MNYRSLVRRVVSVGVVAASTVAGALVAAQPAQAVSAYGCAWPRVCFYNDSGTGSFPTNPISAYQDAGYWQTVGSRTRTAEAVYNSRNDDVVLLRLKVNDSDTSTTQWCIKPNGKAWINPWEAPGGVYQLKILTRSTCP